jgi:hypothetical protein
VTVRIRTVRGIGVVQLKEAGVQAAVMADINGQVIEGRSISVRAAIEASARV